jgi:hypothetical protein
MPFAKGAKATPTYFRALPGALQGTMKPSVIPCIAALLSSLALSAEAPALSSIDVAALEAGFDSQPLDRWLREELGEQWEIIVTPSLTDCGEQSGNPGQRDFPLCIEVKLTKGSKVGFLHIVVGSYQAGVSGPPQFFFGVMDGRSLNKLSELHSASAL